MFKGTKNMFLFLGHFFTVFYQFKPIVLPVQKLTFFVHRSKFWYRYRATTKLIVFKDFVQIYRKSVNEIKYFSACFPLHGTLEQIFGV